MKQELFYSEVLNQPTNRSLYHNRTHAVTEAYALTYNFKFKALKNSGLICGISFCNI
jgi:hypothetical protein